METAEGPLESAVVVLTPRSAPHWGHVPPIHRITDRRGRWSIDDLEPGRYVLTATAPGHAAARTELVVADDGTAEAPTLALAVEPDAPRIQGMIHDVYGAPIAGALVVATAHQSGMRWSFATRSDAAGTYRLSTDEPITIVTVHHPDHVLAWRSDVIPRNARSIRDFRLEPAAIVTGRVVDAHGDPRPGVFVRAQAGPEEGLSARPLGFDPPTTRTDDRGRFELAVRAGSIGLTAVGPHDRGLAPTWIERGIAERGDPLELVVRAAQTVSGTIHRAGRPVRGRWVSAHSLATGETFEAMVPSGPDGRFTIPGLTAGVYELSAPGLESPVRTTVMARDIDDLVLALPPGPPTQSVAVEILPPGRYSVDLSPEQPRFVETPLWGRGTDARGQLTFETVPHGHYTLVAVHPDGRIAERTIVVGPTLAPVVEVRAKPRSTLTGFVRDAAGRPQPGLTIRAARLVGEDRPSAFTVDPPPVLTDQAGRYRVHGLMPGPYRVQARDTQGPVPLVAPTDAERWRDPTVTVQTDHQTLTADLTVQLPSDSLRGTVHDSAGRPRAGVRVFAQHDDVELDPDDDLYGRHYFSPAPTTVTDAQGRFTIPGTHAGPHEVLAVDPRSGAFARRPGVHAGTPLELRLEDPGVVEFQVTPPELSAPPLFVVTEGPSAIERTAQLHEGALSLTRLRAGDYFIGLSSPAGMAQARRSIRPGQTIRLPLTLVPWATVEGRLVAAHDGSPLADVEVILSPLDVDSARGLRTMPRLHESMRTDAEGRFSLRRVLPGTRELWVPEDDGPGQSLLQRSIEVGAGAQLDLGSLKARAPTPSAAPRSPTGLGLATTTWDSLRILTPDLGPPPRGISEHDEHLWVELIAPSSPADDAGLQVGDRVLAIDALRVDVLGREVVEGTLGFGEGIAGHTYVLEIDRAGRAQTIRMTLPPP